MSLRIESQGDLLVVPPGIQLFPVVRLSGITSPEESRWTGLDDKPVHIDLEASFDPIVGTYVVSKMALSKTDDGPEITSAMLREVKVLTLLRLAVQRVTLPEDRTLWPDWIVDRQPELLASGWGEWATAGRDTGRGPDELVLRAVALTYRVAQIARANPAQSVAEAFGLHTRTATNWIKRARSLGLLGGDGGID